MLVIYIIKVYLNNIYYSNYDTADAILFGAIIFKT